ncbi:MAG: sulfatase-like hydrolase/transferase [Actinomycetota bacterium]
MSASETEAEPSEGEPPERRRRPLPFHPILLAAFPVLHLFRTNLHEVTTGQALGPLGIVAGGAAVLLALAWLVLRDIRRAGLLVSLIVLLFFSYGYVADAFEDWEIAGVSVGRDRYVLVLWGVLAIGGGYLLLRIRKALPDVTTILNGVSLILVLTTAVPIVADKIGGSEKVAAPLPSVVPTTREPINAKRDIYYVNFDRYGGEDSLGPYFDYDNRPFLTSLEQKGFIVAHHARANYPNTGHSLSSMLNMTFLDGVAKEVGPSSENDWRPLYGLIKKNEVSRFLKSQGYRYVHIGSWFEATRTNALADETISYDPLSEFSRSLLETTPLEPLSNALGIGGSTLDPRRVAWARVLFQLEQMVRVGNDGKPTFVFAHIIMPHQPYVFERDGSFLDAGLMKRRHWHRNYLEGLQFANTMMTRIADRLLAGPDKSDPIIIFASDEGPPPGNDASATNPDPEAWISKTSRQLRQKFPILSALYLPGVKDPGIPQDITPVNFFRAVFSLYFGADLPLLPDKSYVWQDLDHLYDFTEITDQVAGPQTVAAGTS